MKSGDIGFMISIYRIANKNPKKRDKRLSIKR